MIMPAGRPLLLPANPRFIAFTIVLALLLNLLLGHTGQHWLPDLLALTLVFWNVHQPRRVGMVLAMLMGLLMDVHESALLGQNALSYVLLSYMALSVNRRLVGFGPLQQALQMLPMFLLAAAVEWLSRLLALDGWPQWPQLLAPLLQAALWPVASVLLLAPQRGAHDHDDIRPL